MGELMSVFRRITVLVLPLALLVAIPIVAPSPATAADRLSRGHGTGLDLKAEAEAAARIPVRTFSLSAASPATYDLSRYAVVSGDQGSVLSCVSWATAYTALSLLMNKQGIPDSPMAPMYVYAQIVKGREKGTAIATNLQIVADQGVDTRSHYAPGDFDFTTQPTDAQRANAARYKISGYDRLAPGPGARHGVKAAISQGQPVIIALNMRYSFADVTAADPVYRPGTDADDPLDGSHAVTIVGYDEQGVKIQNSWGTDWGANGFFTTSWSTIESLVEVPHIYAMRRIVQN